MECRISHDNVVDGGQKNPEILLCPDALEK